ncbi:hypothetical protein U1Q18_047276 [Sarracenia purpurea var. burkii]
MARQARWRTFKNAFYKHEFPRQQMHWRSVALVYGSLVVFRYSTAQAAADALGYVPITGEVDDSDHPVFNTDREDVFSMTRSTLTGCRRCCRPRRPSRLRDVGISADFRAACSRSCVIGEL